MKISEIKYDALIIRLLIIAGLGCSMFYSTQLFDGVKTAKTFYFIIIVCLMLFFLSGKALWKKKTIAISLTIPDFLLTLYAVWAFIRLLTADTDSVHNVCFREFSACVLWYFCLRAFFSAFKGKEKLLSFFLILLGYVQLAVCLLQLAGMMTAFSPIFPVSGTFDNTSELCIYLTCILPVTANTGLKASDTTSTGRLIRAACLLFVVCWLVFVLTLGSRTALLSGILGMAVFMGFQTGFFTYLKRKTNSFVRKALISTILLLMVSGLVFLLVQYKKDSANGRLLIWKVAWSGIMETPVQGQGFNAFQAKYGHYQAAYFQKHIDNQKEIWVASNMTIAMNDYVETAFNLGFIGLLLSVAFWLSLFKGVTFETTDRNSLHLVALAVFVIFLVSSGYYFLEKMLAVKTIALLFAAYAGSNCRNITNFHIRSLLLKAIAATCLIFCCFAGTTTFNKIKHYAQWKKADTLSKFGYTEDARTVYENTVKNMRHDGLFLFFYARNLYENKAYQQCLEYMEMAKPQSTGSGFYSLLGDACFKTGDYNSAISYYKYAASIVPNRFRPLYKLFKLYEETGETQQALAMAQNIVNKPVKVDSNEIREIKKECMNYLDKYEQDE